jgi:pyruvate,water dikinase
MTIEQQAQKTRWILWLETLNSRSLPEAGGKGANLGEMIGAGLPVPPGFVVTTDAYWALFAVDGLKEKVANRLVHLNYQDVTAVTGASEAIAGWINETKIPEAIRADILQAYARLSGLNSTEGPEGEEGVYQPVAVRSSATAEDLPNASFAGQQETYLGVRNPDAVLRAVQKCWASLWTPQAISYRASMGYEQLNVALAVVVQAMVPADVAGVMFTANPVNGQRDEILISASYGLGESVVSGAVTPDTYRLGSDGTIRERFLGSKETQIRSTPGGTQVVSVAETDRNRFCLGDSDLAALTEMAGRVQAHYGAPQDTEWAIRNGTLYLLQARPITTLKTMGQQDEEIEPSEQPLVTRPPRGIENIIDHVPEPPLPLDTALILNDAFNLFFAKLGFRPPTGRGEAVERPDGRIAIKMAEPGFSPAVFLKFPAHLVSVLLTDPWKSWEPLASEFSNWVRRLENERRAAQSPSDLVHLIDRSYVEFEHLFARRYLAAFFPGILYDALVHFWVQRAVGKIDAPALQNRLYRATPYPTALQNQAMTDLASLMRVGGSGDVPFRRAFEQFLQRWGNRPVRGMIALPSSPIWAEQPEVAQRMVAALAMGSTPGKSGDQERQEHSRDYQAAKERVEKSLGPITRRWFRLHLDRARKALVIREEGLSLSEDYNAFLRQAILQLARMLVERKILNNPEDIFYLLMPELEKVSTGNVPDVGERIARRKNGYRKLLAAHAKGRHWLFATNSIPPLPSKKPAPSESKNTLRGLSASQGEITARVRVIMGPDEFEKMQKGEVLVAPFTAPAWTPLFGLAAAVVTDIGSLASHAAIVAREYGIPCVVAVSGATQTLRDGQWIHVNGSDGVITILEAVETKP